MILNWFNNLLCIETFNQYEAPEVSKAIGAGVSKMEMQGKIEEKRKK